MGLRFKFNAVLLLSCAVSVGLAMALSVQRVRDSATADIEREIAMLRAKATAVRSYTLHSVEPLLRDGNDVLFLPETVTSFAARAVFDTFKTEFPDYAYKEAALNPTNPADLPNALERELIEQFRADPDLQRLSAEVDGPAGPALTVAFPLAVRQEGCLQCHSTPEVAPPAMVDLYGSVNGFGWQLGETVGAQFITAPMSLVDQRMREIGMILLVTLGAAFVLVFAMTNIMLSRIVLRPVAQMSRMAEQVSMGDFSQPEYEKPGRDELSTLAESFNRMRRSLERAMDMIDV